MDAHGLHPVAQDGAELDATFDLVAEQLYRLTYFHKAGGRGDPRSVNVDYHVGLELILKRLASVNAEIVDIAVDSSVARKLAAPERRLHLPFPISLSSGADFRELRMDITRAQKPIARRPDAQPGGGNDQKTILITVRCPVPIEQLRAVLVGGCDTEK